VKTLGDRLKGLRGQYSNAKLHQLIFQKPPFAAPCTKVGSGLILLKNSDFGQNRKIFPRTAQVTGFGEGFGQNGLQALLRLLGAFRGNPH
jgi:hypothetical protein